MMMKCGRSSISTPVPNNGSVALFSDISTATKTKARRLTLDIHALLCLHNLTNTGSLNWSAAADKSGAGDAASYEIK